MPLRMLYLAVKALISGVIVAAVSELAKRYPGLGALVASLPLVSLLGMIWLWRDKRKRPGQIVGLMSGGGSVGSPRVIYIEV